MDQSAPKRTAPRRAAAVSAPPHGATVAHIVDGLRCDILAHRLSPGARLIESALTKRFAVSRGPVREALRRLAAEGLIEHAAEPRRRGATPVAARHRASCSRSGSKWRRWPRGSPRNRRTGGARALRRRDRADLRRRAAAHGALSRRERRLPPRRAAPRRQPAIAGAVGAAAAAADHGPGRRRADRRGPAGLGQRASRHRPGDRRRRRRSRRRGGARPPRPRRGAGGCEPRGGRAGGSRAAKASCAAGPKRAGAPALNPDLPPP